MMVRLAALRSWRTPLAPRPRKLVRDLRRWGLPGGVGAMLAAAAAALLLIVLPNQAAELRADESAWREARARAATLRGKAQGPVDPVEALRRFQSAFPAAQDRHRRVTNLLALSAGMGLQSRRSDLRSQPEPALGLTRVRLSMPLTGSYEDLRRFVDQALRDDPALSLDLLRLERSDTQAMALRAELQWSLWMQAAAASDGAASAAARALP